MFPVELDVRVAEPLTLNAQAVYVSSGTVDGYAIAAGPQLFFSEAFKGGYFFPVFAYASVRGSGAEATAKGGGATLGYQWLLGHFGVRLGGGLVYYSASAHGGTASASIEGAKPVVDAAIGVTF